MVEVYTGGRRTSATGAIFKRELKTSDTIQGSGIVDVAISPRMPDIYDGQGTFHNIFEKSVDGNNLEAGEISLGNSYASCHYIIETPVKAAPTFGAGDLIGLDLNLYHDDLNFNQSQSLADIEIYKFNREISGLTRGTFGVPDTENLIVGSSRYTREVLISDSFNSEYVSSTGVNLQNEKTGEIFLEVEDAFNISKGNIDVESAAAYEGCSAKSLSTFRKRYCVYSEKYGRYICKLKTVAPSGHGRYVVPSRGMRAWRNDPEFYRPAIDRAFCLESHDKEWWDSHKTQDLMQYVTEQSRIQTSFDVESNVTPQNSIFDRVVTMGDVYTNTRDDEGNPIFSNMAKAHFTKDSESGSGMNMRCFFDHDKTFSEDAQSVMCTMRLPKPLQIAREDEESDEMNSLEVDIRFSIKSLSKQHISSVSDSDKFGFNILRAFGIMVATRPPRGNHEGLGQYIRLMNQVSVTDHNNPVSGETENLYNGFVIMRNDVGGAENDNPNDGDLKIHWSGKAGSGSKGWSAVAAGANRTKDMAYIMKDGADNDSNPDSGGGDALDADYVDELQPNDSTKPTLETKEYYTCKLLINDKNSAGAMDCRWVILDNNENIIATRKVRHVGGSPTSTTHLTQSFPQYLTLFVHNCDVGGYDELLSTDTGAIYNTNGVSTDVDVVIDSIKITGFEATTANMSTAPRNLTRQAGFISGSDIGAIDTDGTFTVGSTMPTFADTLPVPTYLSFGTKSDVFASSQKVNVFMGDYSCVNPKFSDASDNAKSMSVDDSGGRDSGQANLNHKNSDVILRMPQHGGTAPKLGVWCCDGSDDNINDGRNNNDALLLEGTNYVDDFTKKGFFTIDFASTTDPANYIARENPMFSTKITEINSKNTVQVLNPNVLKGFDDDEFIIYRAGYAYGTDMIKTVSLKNGKTVGPSMNFEENIVNADDGSTPLVVDKYLNELYISPKRFWFLLEIYHLDTTNNERLPDKSYGYALLQNGAILPGDTVRGITFNESLYSDTAGDSNRWNLDFADKGGLVENTIDYGYGAYEEEAVTVDSESGQGYIAKYVPQANYQAISLDGLIEKEKGRLTKPDEKISLYVKASEETDGICSIRTSNYSLTASDPFFTFYYVDGLPTIEDFKISPNKDNPVFPDFEWSSKDDDLWYGFLMFSDTEIKHQYHDAVAVIHLNETDVSSTSNIKLKRYDGVHNGTEVESTAIGGTMATSTEGLAGNALLTDASEGCFVTFADNTYTQDWGRNEFSVVAHFTCDSIAHTGFIVGKFGEFDLSVDTSGNVNAAITPQGGTEVTLKSTSVINTDGETPTNVILTFDRNLVSGNVKLFINGKLEDQSGLRTAAGSANNWKSDTNLANDASARLTIGIEPVDGTGAPSANGFSGKIEEIVLYSKAIYPVVPKTGKFTFTKPIEELSVAPIATGISNVARLFIKDYHNIRGTSSTQVAASSNIAYKKAGFGLRTDTG